MLLSLRCQRGFTLIEMMIVIVIVGLLAAIALPNFLSYQVKSRQAEAKTNLGGIYISEISYFGESSRYGNFQEIGFAVATLTNRYTYRSGAGGGTGGNSTNTSGSDYIPAVTGQIVAEGSPAANNSATAFTVTAIANLDTDLTFDRWHVNDRKENLLGPDSNDVDN